jgi:hypothetical protein
VHAASAPGFVGGKILISSWQSARLARHASSSARSFFSHVSSSSSSTTLIIGLPSSRCEGILGPFSAARAFE